MAVQKEIQELKEQSLAWEMLKDARKTNKRMFVIWIITFLTLVGVTCYTIYLLNDVGTISETITQENENGYNNYIGNDGDIINGKANNN